MANRQFPPGVPGPDGLSCAYRLAAHGNGTVPKVEFGYPSRGAQGLQLTAGPLPRCPPIRSSRPSARRRTTCPKTSHCTPLDRMTWPNAARTRPLEQVLDYIEMLMRQVKTHSLMPCIVKLIPNITDALKPAGAANLDAFCPSR